jgi:hypothetical protein
LWAPQKKTTQVWTFWEFFRNIIALTALQE